MEAAFRLLTLASVFLAITACASSAWADGALGPENVAGQWGEGPDYIGNTSDDAWQYWFENQGVQNTFLQLDTYFENPAWLPSRSSIRFIGESHDTY